MKLGYILRIILFLLMISLPSTQSTGRPITCDAGTFRPGQPAAVTCNLHTNISATELGFNVVRYLPTAPKHDLGTDILVCEWKPTEQKHICDVHDGYTFNISQEYFTINIPAVTKESAGLYNCYIVPQEKAESHPCEMIVTELSRGTTVLPKATITTLINPSKDKGQQSHIWVIILAVVLLLVFLAAMAAVSVFIFIRRRRSKKQKKKKRRDEHPEFGLLLPMLTRDNVDDHVPGEDEAFVKQMWDCLDEDVKNILEGFVKLDDVCREVTTLLQRELKAFSQEASATIGMFSTLVKCLPTGEEKGQFLVMNLGSRSLRILFVKIKGQEIDREGSVNYKIPQDVRLGTCVQLLNFIENRLSSFVIAKQLAEREISVGFVFSFPCKYAVENDLLTARPAKWTKGFNCDGVLGKDFGKLLQQKLKKKSTTCKLTIKIIINDAVGLLMAGVHKDKACRIAFIIGKGVNGCYIKDNGPTGTAEGHSTGKTIVATEWGALGENGALDKFRTEFDQTAVEFSMSPKEQILEKMVGRLYIGEIVRQLLLKLTKNGHLFNAFYSELPALNEKRGFTTEHVLYIDNDKDEDCVLTRDLLVGLQFDKVCEKDCKLVKFVCRIVLQRAAYLAAAALATLIKNVPQRDIAVAIDGSLWRAHPRFKNQMMAKARELVGTDYNVKCLSILDGSGIGAALTTAVSLRSSVSR